MGGVYDVKQSIFELSEQERLELELLRTIIKYGLGEIDSLEGLHPTIKVIMRTVIPQIEANNRRRENGKKGGRPKSEQKANDSLGYMEENQEKSKSAVRLSKTYPNNENVKPNVNVNVNANENDNYNHNFNNNDNIGGLPFDDEIDLLGFQEITRKGE